MSKTKSNEYYAKSLRTPLFSPRNRKTVFFAFFSHNFVEKISAKFEIF